VYVVCVVTSENYYNEWTMTSTSINSAYDYGTQEDIKRKIRQNVYETEAKDATKNPLWQFFNAILTIDVAGDKSKIPFVRCIKCNSLLSCDTSRGRDVAS